MVPMKMGQEDVPVHWTVAIFAQQAFTERSKTGAAVQNNQSSVGEPDLDTCCVPAVTGVATFGSGGRAAYPPELDSHFIGTPQRLTNGRVKDLILERHAYGLINSSPASPSSDRSQTGPSYHPARDISRCRISVKWISSFSPRPAKRRSRWFDCQGLRS